MNLNKVFIIGNLTRDPEMRSLPSGQPVTTFGVATNRAWTDKTGKRQSSVEFHNIVAFGRVAEIAKQYLTKGKSVFVEGRMQTRNWEAQDGTKRNRTEIIVEAMQLGPRPQAGTDGAVGAGGSGGGNFAAPQQQQEQVETIEYPKEEEINPDEIPF